MKASLVIPAHNEEKYIGETIKALLAQDYGDFEIIVVDNASTDKTFEIASSFEKVKTVRENRKGILWARERGRREAVGEIIVNVDADCLPDLKWLSRGMNHFKDMKVVAVTGPYYYFDGSFVFRLVSLLSQKYLYRLANFIAQVFKKGAVLIGGNAFIRAEVLNNMGGYDTSIIFYGEDTATARNVSKHGRVVFDPKLIQKTSARRFNSEGIIKISGLYLFHFFRVIFARRLKK